MEQRSELSSTIKKHQTVLWRILGSDLPPRHHQRQTFNNVKFILENEELTDDICRRWLLNRIWDGEAEKELITLLSLHHELVHRIPFDRKIYRHQFLDPSGLPPKFDPMRIVSAGPRNIAELLALEWVYRRKNLAAIALNEARNIAIALGAKEARWVLPLDGSTFMSKDAICELRELIQTNPEAQYLIIPMVRFFDNAATLKENAKQGENDEPQIGFRKDSSARFDERLRYGNMPKAELLIRLGVPGPWHKWPRTHWELSDGLAKESGNFAIGSWVARLSTGADHRVDATVTNRFGNRVLGIANYCDTIDVGLTNREHLQSSLHCYSEAILRASSHNSLQRVVRWIEARNFDESGIAGFPQFASAITSLALAYRLGGERAFADRAADYARKWFIHPATRVEPKVNENKKSPTIKNPIPARFCNIATSGRYAMPCASSIAQMHWQLRNNKRWLIGYGSSVTVGRCRIPESRHKWSLTARPWSTTS